MVLYERFKGGFMGTKLDKLLLIHKLKKDNIDITNIDLDEIIRLYNLYIDYSIERYKPFGKLNPFVTRFNFLYVPESSYYSDDTAYYSIFTNIINMKKAGLLKFLDFMLMNYAMQPVTVDPINELCRYTGLIISKYYFEENNNLYDYFDTHDDIACEVICSTKYGNIVDSDYVNDDYKNVAFSYNDLYCNYYKDGWCDRKKIIDWKRVLNYTYVYFVTNDLLNKEPERAHKFLESLKIDIYGTIDKLLLYGIDDSSKLLLYIDKLYHEFDQKVKVIR